MHTYLVSPLSYLHFQPLGRARDEKHIKRKYRAPCSERDPVKRTPIVVTFFLHKAAPGAADLRSWFAPSRWPPSGSPCTPPSPPPASFSPAPPPEPELMPWLQLEPDSSSPPTCTRAQKNILVEKCSLMFWGFFPKQYAKKNVTASQIISTDVPLWFPPCIYPHLFMHLWVNVCCKVMRLSSTRALSPDKNKVKLSRSFILTAAAVPASSGWSPLPDFSASPLWSSASAPPPELQEKPVELQVKHIKCVKAQAGK